ncbi:MAG: HEAT repeat domain-containing protein [Methanomicrobiales archaeon]|nr:HEAT repeat domain-containing protein [Methanomicrobiales archaeon]
MTQAPFQNIGNGNIPPNRDLMKVLIVASLSISALIITVYLTWNQESPLFPQLYYLVPHLYAIPIVLVSLWYPRKGFQLVILLIFALSALFVFFYIAGYLIDPILSLLNAGVDLWLVGAIAIYVWYRKQDGMLKREDTSCDSSSWRMTPFPVQIFESHEEEIRYYIAALQLNEEGMRVEAARVLGTHNGKDVLDALIGALNDESRFVREEAAHSIGRMGDERTAELLIERLDDEFRRVREGAVRALGGMGPKAFDTLADALSDPRWRVRMGAAIALRITGDRRAIPLFISLLDDENRFVRREAVKSLGRLGDESILGELERAMQDQDPAVRLRAEHALRRIKPSDF